MATDVDCRLPPTQPELIPASLVRHRMRGVGWRLRVSQLDFAVLASVREVDDQTEGKPDDEASPGFPSETEHHQQRNGDAHDWREWDPWSDEGARDAGAALAEDPDAGADDDESHERADRH